MRVQSCYGLSNDSRPVLHTEIHSHKAGSRSGQCQLDIRKHLLSEGMVLHSTAAQGGRWGVTIPGGVHNHGAMGSRHYMISEVFSSYYDPMSVGLSCCFSRSCEACFQSLPLQVMMGKATTWHAFPSACLATCAGEGQFHMVTSLSPGAAHRKVLVVAQLHLGQLSPFCTVS